MFYGWRIVGVSFVTHFIAVGFVFYSYGIIFEALETEFNASRLGVSGGLATMNAAMALFAIFLGRAVDKYPIRWIMVFGAGLRLIQTIFSPARFIFSAICWSSKIPRSLSGDSTDSSNSSVKLSWCLGGSSFLLLTENTRLERSEYSRGSFTSRSGKCRLR